MARCKRCNKNVGQLYDGLCAACLTVNTRKANEIIEEEMHSYTSGVCGLAHPEILDEPGGFARLLSGPDNRLKGKRNVKIEPSRTNVAKNVEINSSDFYMIVGEFTEKDKKAFMPVFKKLVNKYRAGFESGKYFMCKKSEYGKGDIGGEVLETTGGLVVFKKTSYYEPDGLRLSMYPEKDTSDNDSEEIEDIEFNLGISD